MEKYYFPPPLHSWPKNVRAVFKDALLSCQLAACLAVIVFTRKTACILRSDLTDADAPLVTCFSSLKMNTGPATCIGSTIPFVFNEGSKGKKKLPETNSGEFTFLLGMAWPSETRRAS